MNRRFFRWATLAIACSLLGFLMSLTPFAIEISPFSVQKAFADVEYTSVHEFSSSDSERDQTYESTTAGENAILVSGGIVNFSNSTILKSGDEKLDKNYEDAEITGVNAAILALNSSKIKVMRGTITTNAKSAHGAFAEGDGTIDVSNAEITTSGETSAGVMVANGGTLIATNTTVTTENITSPAIRLHKGEITVSGGEYQTVDAPIALLSGPGALKFSDQTKFTPTSEVAQIFQFNDAAAEVHLSKNPIPKAADTSQILLNVLGETGSTALFSSEFSEISGDIIVNQTSTLVLNFTNRTSYTGAINVSNTANAIKLALDKTSRIILEGDSYISDLENAVEDNSNIFANGHKLLYKNGDEIAINQSQPEPWLYDFSTETTEPVELPEEKDKSFIFALLITSIVAFLMTLIWTLIAFHKYKNREQRRREQEAIEHSAKNTMKKPWEKA